MSKPRKVCYEVTFFSGKVVTVEGKDILEGLRNLSYDDGNTVHDIETIEWCSTEY